MKNFKKSILFLSMFAICLFMVGCENNYLIGRWYFTEVEVCLDNEMYAYSISEVQNYEIGEDENFDNLTNEEKAKFYAKVYSENYKDISVEFKKDKTLKFSTSQDINTWEKIENKIKIYQQENLIEDWDISNSEDNKTFEIKYNIQTNENISISLILTK